MSQREWTITPVDLGTLVGFDKSSFTLRHAPGVKLDVPCLAYVLQGGGRTILVDTGPCGAERSARHHRPLRKEPGQELPAALRGLGVDPRDIDLVLLTHLHWDHCFNLEHLPRAAFVVQRRELAYAACPLPADRAVYEAQIPGIRPPWMGAYDRIIPVEGDTEVAAGVRVILLPGHTPGFQGVAVATRDGEWAIAGDTIPILENWEKTAGQPKTPSGLYQNLFDYYDSLNRLNAFGSRILPGHDARVLDQPRYPLG